MGKKIIIAFLFTFIPLVSSFSFNYWWMDVHVDGFTVTYSLSHSPYRPSTQRVFFFRDTRSLQQATGYDNFFWIAHDRRPYRFQQIIYDTMRRENFRYALVLVGRTVARNEPPAWHYSIFTFRNGREHVDHFFRRHQPLRF